MKNILLLGSRKFFDEIEEYKKIIAKEGIILLGFIAFWIICYLRNHYIFVKCGISINFEHEVVYALGTTLIAYTLYWIVRLILWAIRVKKEMA